MQVSLILSIYIEYVYMKTGRDSTRTLIARTKLSILLDFGARHF